MSNAIVRSFRNPRHVSAPEGAAASDKVEHLRFIVSHMALVDTHSFISKLGAVALVLGLFAIHALDLGQAHLALLSLTSAFMLVVFWLIDANLYRQHSTFAHLYDDVRQRDETDFDLGLNHEPAIPLRQAMTAAPLSYLYVGGLVAVVLLSRMH